MQFSDITTFMYGVLAFAIILTLLVFVNPQKALSYFKSKDGKKPLMGIKMFILIPFLVVLLSFGISKCAKADEPKGEWFAYGELFLGVDYTKELSPQCYATGPNSRLTSNGGIRANVFQNSTKRVEFNVKYTHHSCAFSQDRERYDAIGGEVVIRLW